MMTYIMPGIIGVLLLASLIALPILLHSLNDAMRVASKRLLRDLWREARRCHGFTD